MVRMISIGLIGTLLVMLLRPTRPELAMVCGLATGAIILLSMLDTASQTIDLLTQLGARFKVDPTLFAVMIKATGVAYIAEFAIQACKDAGENGIASKMEMGAKFVILAICLPLVTNLIEVLGGVMP